MRIFALLIRAGFRRHSTYRLALLAGMTTNSVFGIIRAYVLVGAVTSAGSQIGGFDVPTVLAFVWWGQALLGAVNIWGFQEVGDRVRSGDIAVDFLRPINPQLTYLAGDLGRAGIHLIVRGAPTLLIGALLFEVAWPPGLDSWALGLVSVVIAVVVAFAGTFIVNLSAFWLIEVRGIRLVWMITSGFLCGLYVPIPWFPYWLRTIAQWTPFPAMLQNPLDILSGRVDGGAIWTTLASQVAWGAVLIMVGQVVLKRGRRRLEVQGG